MSEQLQDSLAEMLFGFHELENMEQLKELVLAAHKGSAAGANHFADTTGKDLSPQELKNFLRCYPLAQAMVAVIRHYELNRDLDTLKIVMDALFDSLEEPKCKETLH